MTDYRDIFQTQETQNWFKCALALRIATEGIVSFVETEINSVHQKAVSKVLTANGLSPGSTCYSCTTQSVVPCPAKGICNKGRCGFHDKTLWSACPKNICNKLFSEIVSEHKYSTPSWKNTDATKWCSSPWEFAKCFCPPDGYTNVSTARDTDFNGLVSVLQNCKHFHNLLTSGEDKVKKAREAGRTLRHCAELKVDQATTLEHIDALIDLLSAGQCLLTDRDATSARKELDKLKHDKLLPTVKEIQYVIAQAFDQTKEDLNDTVKQSREELKNDIAGKTSELQQKLETLEEIKTNAAALETQVSGLEVRVDSLDHRCNSQDESLSSLNGKLTKYETTVSELDQRLACVNQIVIHPKGTSEPAWDQYDVLKKALQRNLIDYYREKTSAMPLCPLRPDLDENLEDFYVQPKIIVKQVSKKVIDSKNVKQKRVLTYKDVFEIGNIKNIYIQGDPGMGKSTYCTKLTLDWCKYTANRLGTEEITDNERKMFNALQFDFLFLISLRESSDTCSVKEMINDAIITGLSEIHEYNYTNFFLSQLLEKECCLIILDGLDEWSHPENVVCRKFPKHIPHRCSGGKCVFLTLSRPWKLSQNCLKDSEIDVLFEIKGVEDPEELATKVLRSLNDKEEKSRDINDFLSATERLSDLMIIPVIAMQLACIWFEIEQIPESKCEIYTEMLKLMLERKNECDIKEMENITDNLPRCFSGREWSTFEKRILKQLGNLAFETLFPKDGQQPRVVFSDKVVNHHLEDQIKRTALFSGLLTEYKLRTVNRKESQFSFLHKTFQEFLAGFYLLLQVDQRKEFISRLKMQGENKNDISQMFIFLCGLEPSLAKSVSQVLMERTEKDFTENPDDVSIISSTSTTDNKVQYIVDIVNKGFKECVQNGHNDVDLEMTHCGFFIESAGIVIRPDEALLQQNITRLETILCIDQGFYKQVLDILKQCAKTVKTLLFQTVDNSLDLSSCSSLKSFIIEQEVYIYHSSGTNTDQNFVNLEMSNCTSLELLNIRQSGLSVTLNTDHLHTCTVKDYDFSQGNLAKTLMTSNKRLTSLALECCTATTTNSGDTNEFHLDLTTCDSLKDIKIESCDIALSINVTNLENCDLQDYDLALGNIVEVLKNAWSLTSLLLASCKTTKEDDVHTNRFHIDLTACNSLRNINIRDCDIILSINTVSLKSFTLDEYNISLGNVSGVLKDARSLTTLDISSCSTTTEGTVDRNSFRLDLSACKTLKKLSINDWNIPFSINTTNLEKCYFQSVELSPGNVIEYLNNALSLKTVHLANCKTETDIVSDSSKSHIDLSQCKCLRKLTLDNCDIGVSINAANLVRLILEEYDISLGNIAEALKDARSLKLLYLENCKTSQVNDDESCVTYLDMTACSSLNFIKIHDSDVAVRIDATNLQTCTLHDYDLRLGNIVEVLNNALSMTSLSLANCRSTNGDDSCSFDLDLTGCSSLRDIDIRNCDIILSINAVGLKWFTLEEYDPLLGNIAEILKDAKLLKTLDLNNCKTVRMNTSDTGRIHCDLTACSGLTDLTVRDCDISLSINETKLEKCLLSNFDLSLGNIAEVLKNARLMTIINLENCKSTAMSHVNRQWFSLDLTACKSLRNLVLLDCDIFVSIDTDKMLECQLSNYDLSLGNLLEILKKSPNLRFLELKKCVFPERDKRHKSKETIDLSLCKRMLNIRIEDSDLIVKYNDSIVGTEESEWGSY